MMKKSDFYMLMQILVCWYKFMETKSWLKNNQVDMVKSGLATLVSGHKNLLYLKKEWMELTDFLS